MTPALRPPLARIVGAADLDELRRAVRALDRLGADDLAALAALVSTWRDDQAIANLLMYPKLLPPELRAAALLRALDGTAPYLTLAAVVGLEALDGGRFTDDERVVLRERLLALVSGVEPLLAVRAAAALAGYLDGGELARVVPLLAHRDPRVAHNLIVALAEHVDIAALDAAIAREVSFTPDLAAVLRARLRPTPPDTPVLPYLPSLRACSAPAPG